MTTGSAGRAHPASFFEQVAAPLKTACYIKRKLHGLYGVAQQDWAEYIEKTRVGARAVMRREQRRIEGRPLRPLDADEREFLADEWAKCYTALSELADLVDQPARAVTDDAIRRELLGAHDDS